MSRAGDFVRRRWRWLVAAAVAIVIGAGAAAVVAWHFSDAVLVPDHSPWPAEDVTVEGLAPGRIVLSRDEDSERPGVYGLDWLAGHAIVGAVSEIDDDTVTRSLRKVSGYLVPETKVGVDASVYAGNPRQALGLPFADVRVPDELGPMPAWLVPGRSRTWAILVHGINSDPRVGMRIVPTLHRQGLPALLITYREDLGAPPSPDGLHHMGLTEWRDLQAAARYALAHGARRLVLVGYSMGGALVTQFMQRSSLAPKVAALVLDAPVFDWKETLSYNTTQYGFPSIAAIPLEWAIDARIDPDWDSLDAARHPEAFQLPILLFHGSDDKVVPISTSTEFAEELAPRVTYYQVPKAGHVESWNIAPALYEERLIAFLSR